MNRFLSLALVRALLSLAIMVYCAVSVWSEPVPGSLPGQWNIGAENCAASPQAPLQVHAYEPQTFILRQNPCANPEANFLYLFIGSQKALLIDTGADRGSKQDAAGATYHPNERPLELSREDLTKLPSALASFNGFYASHEDYSITHPMHNLLAVLCAAFVLLSVLGFASYRLLLCWRRRRCRLASS